MHQALIAHCGQQAFAVRFVKHHWLVVCGSTVVLRGGWCNLRAYPCSQEIMTLEACDTHLDLLDYM